MTEPQRSGWCNSGLCRTTVAPHLRCDGVAIFRDATPINDGKLRNHGDHGGFTAEPRRSWRCHCGLCHTSTAVVPRLRCDGGITGTQSFIFCCQNVSTCYHLLIMSSRKWINVDLCKTSGAYQGDFYSLTRKPIFRQNALHMSI